MANKKLYKSSLYVLFGSILLFLGVGFILYASWIVKTILDVVLVLKPDTFVFNLWQRPPTLNKLSIYLFNWTNYHEVYNNKVKPKFEEVGPYIYYEQIDKKDVIFNDNDTLTYKLTKIWYFDEKNSRSLNDTIVTVNALAAVSNFLFSFSIILIIVIIRLKCFLCLFIFF